MVFKSQKNLVNIKSLLRLIFFLFFVISFSACTNSIIQPENINIVVNKGRLTINNTDVNYPFSMEEITKLLGPHDASNDFSVTWNKYGIEAILLEEKNTADHELNKIIDLKTNYSIRDLIVTVGREDNKDNLESYLLTCGAYNELIPTEVFKGKITINGFNINSDTSAEMLVTTLTKYSLASNSKVLNRKGRYIIISKGDDVNKYWLSTMVCINKSDNKLKTISIDLI